MDTRSRTPDDGARAVAVRSDDGARSELQLVGPRTPIRQALYWLPAMGVPARHYLPFADAMAERGVAVALHEWRGIGASDRRAGRHVSWGYRELLAMDMPAGLRAAREQWPQARWTLGGHSLGGQLATLHAALDRVAFDGLALIASGAPYWRSFRFPRNLGLLAACALVPPLCRLRGYFPGRSLGFGGNEARGVMADWARSGRTGRYSATGMEADLEAAMHRLELPVLALRLQKDGFGPRRSLAHLLDKLPLATVATRTLMAAELGARADHFAWMKTPSVPADLVAAWMRAS